jgi:xyloglucan-specific endo-beta-1,4-glucanase
MVLGRHSLPSEELRERRAAVHSQEAERREQHQIHLELEVSFVASETNCSRMNSSANDITRSYSTTDVVADVAYDMFLSSTPDGSNEYEIMVWLAALGGAGPISSTGSAIATVTINGVSWNVFVGPNGSMTVYSFVATSTVTSFSGDLLEFFKYLENNQGLSSSLYLIDVQAGTEPFTGTADMKTSSYSAVVV